MGFQSRQAQEHFLSGNEFLEREDAEAAIREYRHAIRLDSKVSAYYGGLAHALTVSKKYVEAEAVFKTALKLDPENPFLLVGRGMLFLECDRPETALADCERALKVYARHAFPMAIVPEPLLEPDGALAQIYVYIGHAHDELGNEQQALKYFRKAVEADPENTENLYALALTLEEMGEHEESTKTLETILKLNPDDENALLLLGKKHIFAGRQDEARKHLSRVLKAQPEHTEAIAYLEIAEDEQGNIGNPQPDKADEHYRRGIELWSSDRNEEAIKEFRLAIQCDPRDVRPYCSLGNALYLSGKDDEGHAMLKRAVRINPDFPFAHCSIGFFYIQNEQWQEAQTAFKRAFELHEKLFYHGSIPKSLLEPDIDLSKICTGLAEAEIELDQEDEAIKTYRQAINYDPQNTIACQRLANLFEELGRPRECVEIVDKLLAIDPDDIDALFQLGREYMVLKRPAEAIVPLKRAIEIDPDDIELYESLAAAYEEAGQFDEAVRVLRDAIENAPEGDELVLNLVIALVHAGRSDEAEVLFERAVELSDDLAYTYSTYAEALIKTGAIEEAKKLLAIARGHADENSHNLSGLALSFVEVSDCKAAAECLEKALSLQPNVYAMHKLGCVYGALGQREKSIKMLNQALQTAGDDSDEDLTDELHKLIAAGPDTFPDGQTAEELHTILMRPVDRAFEKFRLERDGLVNSIPAHDNAEK
jgi:tetratricopeptide (TPR) repeat protein